MLRLLSVCAGGALGTALRYLVGLAAIRFMGTAFPYGTLAVNVIGSFCMGALMTWGARLGLLQSTLLPTLTTGLLGGFTTYSAFNFETMRFIQEEAYGMALLYLGSTLAGCLASGALGMVLTHALMR